MKKPSVLFLGDVINARYGLAARGLLYTEYLKKKGFDVEIVSCTEYKECKDIPEDFPVPYLPENQILEKAAEFDILFCIKVIHPRLICQIYEKTKAIIVFDMYDSLASYNQQKYNDIFSKVDVFVAEGNYIKDILSVYGKPVFDLKSVCVYEDFCRPKTKQNSLITIGWMGSISTYKALTRVQNAINHLFEHYNNIQLRIVGAYENTKIVHFSENVKVTYVPVYDHKIMLEELGRFDIGIYPPPGDDYDYKIRGPHKGLRYMGAKIATIYYGIGECLEFVDDKKNAMIYLTEEEFESKLELLIQNNDLRKSIAEAGYEFVCREYSFHAVAEELCAILTAVANLYLKRFNDLCEERNLSENNK